MLGYAATTNFAITLASLATGSSRESTNIIAVVGGTSYDDVMIQFSVGTTTPTTAGSQAVYVWFYGSADGTNFISPCTGTDAAVTIGTGHNLKGPFVVAVLVGTLQYNVNIPSVSQFFGGVMPKRWGVVVENQTNGALNGTESNFNKWFTPVFYTT